MSDNKFKVDVPVLLVGFNRPDIIQQSVENLSHYALQKLYVAIDGPRAGNKDDDEKVAEVRKIVKGINYCPNVYYKISDENHGAEVTVSSAIAWVFEQEECVIVMEDDIIAHRSFFQFMQEMLSRYMDDPRVAMVSGCNYTPIEFPNNEDYCFCQSGHTWGWATWRRVWKDFDLFEKIDSNYLSDSFLIAHSANKEIAQKRKIEYSDMKSKGCGNSTWDYMFSYFRVTRGLLSIVPRSHLTSNIGLYGLHAKGKGKGHNMIIDDDFVVKVHPESVYWLKDYDVYHYENWSKRYNSKIKCAIFNLLIKMHLFSTYKKIRKFF